MGIKLVLVHGFRPQVNEQLRVRGHPARYSHGMRITDAVALDCAQEAAGQLRFEIEAAFSQGLPNTPMANAIVRVVSGNFLTARPVGIVDGVDFMHSGVVRKVDSTAIPQGHRHRRAGAALALRLSPTGEAFNLSMEDVATSAAMALQADKLLFITGSPASTRRPTTRRQPDRHRAAALADAERLLAALPAPRQPSDPVLPAPLRGGLPAAASERSHIPPFAEDGALLLECSRTTASAPWWSTEAGEPARGQRRRRRRHPAADRARSRATARWSSAAAPRSSATSANYTVIEHDGVIFGCAALYAYPESRTGELAALTVSPRAGPGRRRKVILKAHRTAPRRWGLESIFVLTTRTMHWFIKRGFRPVDPDWLPRRASAKYNWDRRSQVLVKL